MAFNSDYNFQIGQKVKIDIKHPDHWCKWAYNAMNGQTGTIAKILNNSINAHDGGAAALIHFDPEIIVVDRPGYDGETTVSDFWVDITYLEVCQ